MRLNVFKRDHTAGDTASRHTTLLGVSPEQSASIYAALRSPSLSNVVKAATQGQVEEIDEKIDKLKEGLAQKNAAIKDAKEERKDRSQRLNRAIGKVIMAAYPMMVLPGAMGILAQVESTYASTFHAAEVVAEKKAINDLTEDIYKGDRAVIKESHISVGNKHDTNTVYSFQQAHHLAVRVWNSLNNDKNSNGAPPLPNNWWLLNRATKGELNKSISIDGGDDALIYTFAFSGGAMIGTAVDIAVIYSTFFSAGASGTGIKKAFRKNKAAKEELARVEGDAKPLQDDLARLQKRRQELTGNYDPGEKQKASRTKELFRKLRYS